MYRYNYLTTPSNPVTFDDALVQLSAKFLFDYLSLSKTSYSISNTNPVTIPIPIYNDSNREGLEEFGLLISNLKGAAFLNGGTSLNQVITIIDDEIPRALFWTSSKMVAEDEGMVDLELRLSGPTLTGATVTYTTSAGTGSGDAIAGSDFIAPTADSNTFTIPAGEDRGNIPDSDFK